MSDKDKLVMRAEFKGREPEAQHSDRDTDSLIAGTAVEAIDKLDISNDIQINVPSGNGFVKEYNMEHGTVSQKKTTKSVALTAAEDTTPVSEKSGSKVSGVIYMTETSAKCSYTSVDLAEHGREAKGKNDFHKATKPKRKRSVKTEVDNSLDELLHLTKDVPNANRLTYSTENNSKEPTLKAKQNRSKNGDDAESSDGAFQKTFSSTEEECDKKEIENRMEMKRGRSQNRSILHRRKRRDSSDDQKYTESSRKLESSRRRFRSKLRKQNDADKYLDEALKFTSNVMDVEEPGFTTKRKKIRNVQTSVLKENGGLHVNHSKVCDIDGSKELYTENNKFVINDRETKKPCRVSIMKGNQNMVLVKKIKTEKVIIRHSTDDDVYDISPVKNRERLSDTDSEANDVMHKEGSSESSFNNAVTQNSDMVTYVTKPNKVDDYAVTGGNMQRMAISDLTKQIWNYDLEGQVDSNSKKKKGSRRTGLTKNRKNNNKNEGDVGGDGGLFGGNDRIVDDMSIVKTHKDVNDPKRRINDTEAISASRNQTEQGLTSQQPNGQKEKCCVDGNILMKPMKYDIQFEWEDIMYDSDIESGCYSGSEITRYTPSIKSCDLSFPWPASDRSFVVSGSDKECTKREICDKTVLDEPETCMSNSHNEELNEKKVGRLERLLRWLFCCVKPKVEK